MNTMQEVHDEHTFPVHPLFLLLGLIVLQLLVAATAGWAAHQIMMPERPFTF